MQKRVKIKQKDIKKVQSDMFWKGYRKGKRDTVSKILKFVEEESEFIPDIHSDALLDRLVEIIKKI